jgi:hypothetical protein
VTMKYSSEGIRVKINVDKRRQNLLKTAVQAEIEFNDFIQFISELLLLL